MVRILAPMVRSLVTVAVVLWSAPALAAGPATVEGFASGFLHPIWGFDHLLAMVAVGLVSVQIGGRAVVTVPAVFVGFLAIGGAMGLFGLPLPQVEGAIALSVLALGLAIAMQRRLPTWLIMGLVAFFAIFHGHAHGSEIPNMASPTAYVGGFLLASAMLHLTGVGIGALCGRPQLRAQLGAGFCGVGAHMVLLTYGIV